MPTVLTINGVRYHFYSDEGNEPPHIHCRYQGNECKFWLQPVQLANNRGLPAHKIREIESIVFENQFVFIEAYNEHRNRQR